ncbi:MULTISPECIES: hypothetical protein [Methylotenera]|uniref:hypothetical protein n=1 Tax=Methylotenera TaxID=359407 RepID=UPI00037FB8CD|nr:MULTISPECIES: hypothetical protein [Methylotenera]
MNKFSAKPLKLLKIRGFILLFSLLVLILFMPAIHAESAQKKSARTKNANSAEMAKQSMALHSETLQKLMLTLYQYNPKQLKKSTQVSAEEMVQWTFEGPFGWKFDGVRRLQGTDALKLTSDANFPGDRVLALVAGLQTMLAKAYGGKTEYDFSGEINPQNLYNAARNIEITSIKLNQLNSGIILPNGDKPADLKPTDLTHELIEVISRVDTDANRIAKQKKQVIQLLDKNSLQAAEWQPQ